MHLTFYELIRYANGFMAAFIVVGSLLKLFRIWADLTVPRRYLSMAYMGLTASVCYGSFDSIRLHAVTSFRISFTCGALILGIIAVLYPDPQYNWMVRRRGQK